MRTYLKVKIKSLAAEARIIRGEEYRCKTNWRSADRLQKTKTSEVYHALYHGLREHRRGVVRLEARLSHVAYAYIRGKTYAKTEPSNSGRLDLKRIAALAARYGGKPTHSDDIEAWILGKPAA